MSEKKVDRRQYIKYIGSFIIGAIIFGGGVAAYYATQPVKEKVIEKTVTVPGAKETITITKTPEPTTITRTIEVTRTITASPSPLPPIKIGVLTPLSPPGDPAAGKLIIRGAELAVEHLNAKGGVLGRKLELVIEDDAGTPEKGAAGALKLATVDKVCAIIGQFHSSVMLAAMDVAETNKVPIFSTQASAKSITAKHYEYTFRTHVYDTPRTILWNKFIKDMGYKRVAILAENTDYGIGLVTDTKETMKKLGITFELKDIIFDRKVVDLTPQLLEIKAWNPDLLINIGVGAPCYLMIKQSIDIGLFPKVPQLVSYDAPIRPEYWDNVGAKGNYILAIIYYHPNQPLTAMGIEMRKAYEEKYKEPPIYGAISAYGQVMIIAQAIEYAKSADPTKLKEVLETRAFIHPLSANVTMPRAEGAEWHHWTPPMMIVQHQKPMGKMEEMVIIYPYEMATGKLVTPT
ncbi:MAG: ABC transporter substrate-binding protein [Nitrososphaerales archaeon]